MALSLAVMVVYVPIYFLFNTVKRRMNNAVIGRVVFNKFMNERNNNSKPATNASNENAVSHVITTPERC